MWEDAGWNSGLSPGTAGLGVCVVSVTSQSGGETKRKERRGLCC